MRKKNKQKQIQVLPNGTTLQTHKNGQTVEIKRVSPLSRNAASPLLRAIRNPIDKVTNKRKSILDRVKEAITQQPATQS